MLSPGSTAGLTSQPLTKCTYVNKNKQQNRKSGKTVSSSPAQVTIKMPARRAVRSGRQNRRGGNLTSFAYQTNAPVSTSAAFRHNNSSGSARICGTDEMAYASATNYTRGQIIINEVLDVNTLPRLEQIGHGFQRVRWHRLKFTVTPYNSTTAGGGYVAAFVKDASDVPPEDGSVINWVLAQEGSVTAKWWESSTVAATVPQQLLYTSESVEARSYSPGRFVVVAIAPSTSVGGVSVICDYEVSFSEPALESVKSTVAPITAAVTIITRSDHQGFWGDLANGDYTDKPSVMFPGIVLGRLYKLPYVVNAIIGSSYYGFQYVEATNGDTLLPREIKSGSNVTDDFTATRPVLESGTVLTSVN